MKEEMVGKVVLLDGVTYFLSTRSLSKVEMLQMGLPPTEVTFTSLINAHCILRVS